MARITEQAKQQRVERVWLAVKRHANGITEAEVARFTGLEPRTVHNYLTALRDEGRIDKDGTLWFSLDYEETRLRAFELSPEEAYTLYLGSRLLVKQHDKRNEPAETALLKLAEVLTADAGVGEEIAQAARELASRPTRKGYQSVFVTMVRGYIYKRRIALRYRPLNGQPFDTIFEPYLLEPSAIGYATYAIGYSSRPGALRAYKLERIESAQLTREAYRVPVDFPGLAILRNSWSIFLGEETVTVSLRFSPQVRERVLETQWHPSQIIRDDPGRYGFLLWSARVADTTDMLPWIRGWGAACEVLEPPFLRASLIHEAQRLTQLYKTDIVAPPPTYQLLWAKTSRDRIHTHPLICHLIDVAQVARKLWEHSLSDAQRRQFARALNLDVDDAGRAVAFWVGLHDLGKASPAFQRKYQPAVAQLKEAGLPFSNVVAPHSTPHATITAVTLPELLEGEVGTPRLVARRIAQALGGHHGIWPTAIALEEVKQDERGDQAWDAVRRELVQTLKAVMQPPAVTTLGKDVYERHAFLTLFSGLTSVADWLGSMEDYFTFADAPVDPMQYAVRAEQRAMRVLEAQGFSGWTEGTNQNIGFTETFGFPPNPIQQTVIGLAQSLDSPSLVIVEAPTGSGKTEAALHLANYWRDVLQQRGFYIAMPTMATSNQMHARTARMMKRRNGESNRETLLIHSQARWTGDPPTLEIGDETQHSQARDMGWFLPRKRSLLAPFAVGTVDQALLGVLKTRHFFVRLFGLSHKTVIFDEVHAYDTYMNELFQRLLAWLRAAGTSVVLLSATLPAATRRALIAAYAGEQAANQVTDAVYPAISWASSEASGIIPLPATGERRLEVARIDRSPEAIVAFLKAKMCEGGCAAVICNTVGRAQLVYRAVLEAGLAQDATILFHARYPFAWRDEIERSILDRFGKEGTRPARAIVVATQVIEQSLDLDFDLIVSDLAPIDLLIQRAGRLHRHVRERRPPALTSPQLVIAAPTAIDKIGDFEGDAYVYEPYVLLRTLAALNGRSEIVIPGETTSLIEAVYGPEEANPTDDVDFARLLAQARARRMAHEDKHTSVAQSNLMGGPGEDGLLYQGGMLEEDDPTVHHTLQPMTRLGPPTVSVVCLHALGDELRTEPDGGIPIDLHRKPDSVTTAALARCAIAISHPALVRYFQANDTTPATWKDHALLRTYQVLSFVDGVCQLDTAGYTLRLSREMGLEIEKEQI